MTIQNKIKKSYSYDEFATPHEKNHVNDQGIRTNIYNYAGYIYDYATSKYFVNARYYTPEVGRFDAKDMLLIDGFNRYKYVSNNPLIFKDAMGLSSEGVDSQMDIYMYHVITTSRGRLQEKTISVITTPVLNPEKYYNSKGFVYKRVVNGGEVYYIPKTLEELESNRKGHLIAIGGTVAIATGAYIASVGVAAFVAEVKVLIISGSTINLSTPDAQMNLMSAAENLGEGDYVGAGFDLAMVVVPGNGSSTSKVLNIIDDSEIDDVIKHLDDIKVLSKGTSKLVDDLVELGQLTVKKSDTGEVLGWTSSNGLFYDVYDKNMGNRVKHVLNHASDSVATDKSLFKANSNEILAFLDDAWTSPNKIAPNPNDTFAHYIDMGSEVIGTDTETIIKMVVNPDTGAIITAYPMKEVEYLAEIAKIGGN